tara:strand:+ start:43 stop:471 length:429 start_codon:yes stop_codon:yes gene_type:complete
MSMGAWADSITLVCEGLGQRTETNYSNSYQNNTGGELPKTYQTVSKSTKQFNTSMTLHIDTTAKSSWIKLPNQLRPFVVRNQEQFFFTELNTSEDEIKARFKLNMVHKPKISIDRLTGKIDYRGWGSFTGDCNKLENLEKKF